jgi:hypothetical protein
MGVVKKFFDVGGGVRIIAIHYYHVGGWDEIYRGLDRAGLTQAVLFSDIRAFAFCYLNGIVF